MCCGGEQGRGLGEVGGGYTLCGFWVYRKTVGYGGCSLRNLYSHLSRASNCGLKAASIFVSCFCICSAG